MIGQSSGTRRRERLRRVLGRQLDIAVRRASLQVRADERDRKDDPGKRPGAGDA